MSLNQFDTRHHNFEHNDIEHNDIRQVRPHKQQSTQQHSHRNDARNWAPL
jgi:hypothetical protein